MVKDAIKGFSYIINVQEGVRALILILRMLIGILRALRAILIAVIVLCTPILRMVVMMMVGIITLIFGIMLDIPILCMVMIMMMIQCVCIRRRVGRDLTLMFIRLWRRKVDIASIRARRTHGAYTEHARRNPFCSTVAAALLGRPELGSDECTHILNIEQRLGWGAAFPFETK